MLKLNQEQKQSNQAQVSHFFKKGEINLWQNQLELHR